MSAKRRRQKRRAAKRRRVATGGKYQVEGLACAPVKQDWRRTPRADIRNKIQTGELGSR